jgi:hypothetical protein
MAGRQDCFGLSTAESPPEGCGPSYKGAWHACACAHDDATSACASCTHVHVCVHVCTIAARVCIVRCHAVVWARKRAHVACERPVCPCTAQLLSSHAIVSQFLQKDVALVEAVKKGDVAETTRLLSEGANVQYKDKVSRGDCTPSHALIHTNTHSVGCACMYICMHACMCVMCVCS